MPRHMATVQILVDAVSEAHAQTIVRKTLA